MPLPHAWSIVPNGACADRRNTSAHHRWFSARIRTKLNVDYCSCSTVKIHMTDNVLPSFPRRVPNAVSTSNQKPVITHFAFMRNVVAT